MPTGTHAPQASPASPIAMTSSSETNGIASAVKVDFNMGSVSSLLETLQSFVDLASWSSAPPVASPSVLWEVLRALCESCVLLLAAHRDTPSHDKESGNSAFRAVAHVATKAAERLQMVEAIVYQQHEALQRSSAAQCQQSERVAAMSEEVERLRGKLEHAERDLLLQMDKLRNGVARHSHYVDDALEEMKIRIQVAEEELRTVRAEVLDVRAIAETHRDAHLVSRGNGHDVKPRNAGIGIAVKEWRNNEAVEIVAVKAGSEADGAGLATGDIIIAVDDKPCRAVIDLRRALEEDGAAAEGTVTLRTMREGQVFERILARPRAAAPAEPSRASVRV